MTYQEALDEIVKEKEFPIIRKKILKIRDTKIQDQLCAKWLVTTLSQISYMPQPPMNDGYRDYLAQKSIGESTRKDFLAYEVQNYIKAKGRVDAENYSTIEKLVIAYNDLHESEEKARSAILNKVREFLIKSYEEPTADRGIYDFTREAKRILQEGGRTIPSPELTDYTRHDSRKEKAYSSQ